MQGHMPACSQTDRKSLKAWCFFGRTAWALALISMRHVVIFGESAACASRLIPMFAPNSMAVFREIL